MILVGIIFSILYWIFDPTVKKVFAVPLILFVLFYSISFDVINHPEIEKNVFEYFRLKLTIRSYFFYFITIISFLIALILLGKRSYYFNYREQHYNFSRLKWLYYIFAVLSLLGFFINISRVIGNIGLIFIAPRAYEEQFGANPFINYLYFLNVPAICLSIYLSFNKCKVRFSCIINVLLIVISFFHGIKFTIFDTLFIPAIFYYLLYDQVPMKKIIIVFLSGIAVFFIFSLCVRGATEERSPTIAFICYIIPNYYNLEYCIETFTCNFGDFMSLITPEKVPSVTSGLSNIEMPPDRFIFNPAYNMTTSLFNLYNTLNILGPLFYILIFQVQFWVYKNRQKSLMVLFLTTYMVYCLLFSFYFYPYIKLKNVYYLAVFVLIEIFCTKHHYRKNTKFLA